MSIEKRIDGVDLNNSSVNTDFRAAVHKKISSSVQDYGVKRVKDLSRDEFTLPLDSDTSLFLHHIHELLVQRKGGRDFIFLSPLGPFGLDSILAQTSALKISHTTGRPADVVADPTTQLAIEVYRRRFSGQNERVSLSTFHRCTRLQRYDDPNYKTTFDMFGTIDSYLPNKDLGYRFSHQTIVSLVDYYLSVLNDLIPNTKFEISIGNVNIATNLLIHDAGMKADDKELALSQKLPTGLRGRLSAEDILSDNAFLSYVDSVELKNEVSEIDKLSTLFKGRPDIACTVQLDRAYGMGHYSGIVFAIYWGDVDVVDGGEVKWLNYLTSNNKEKTVVSGFGTELLARKLVQKDINE